MSQEERYQYYAEHRLDVFLSVSSSESVPSLMLDAMANRIFVCATAVDGVTDVLSNETGLLMPENPTVEQLTAFLEMLCSMDKEKFAARAKLGYDCWQQWFNADETASPSRPNSRPSRTSSRTNRPKNSGGCSTAGSRRNRRQR